MSNQEIMQHPRNVWVRPSWLAPGQAGIQKDPAGIRYPRRNSQAYRSLRTYLEWRGSRRSKKHKTCIEIFQNVLTQQRLYSRWSQYMDVTEISGDIPYRLSNHHVDAGRIVQVVLCDGPIKGRLAHSQAFSALPAMLAWMVAPEFTSDAAIRFKIGRRATE
ncbi:hypothetical protein PCANC_17184 [Puccinia coronata f. sp. avenae]|uniref:Uncharacterized protein n=1 Tax=Puccinia coronata f. sp. avenae TaxID=200324 RepID=A0A2N5SSA0_9BASI|nr:hypothetical protein PCANC_17184 [Puccinia coronata f. sp. avenae]